MLASSGFSGFQSTSIARGGVEPAGNSANLYMFGGPKPPASNYSSDAFRSARKKLHVIRNEVGSPAPAIGAGHLIRYAHRVTLMHDPNSIELHCLHLIPKIEKIKKRSSLMKLRTKYRMKSELH